MNGKELIAVAALLHDVGKVMQRAELPCKSLRDEVAKQRLCPLNTSEGHESGSTTRRSAQRWFSHLHVLWTEQFMESCEHFLDIRSAVDRPDDTLVNLAACHHLPSTPLQRLIAQADIISAGMDRAKRSEDDPGADKGRFKRVPLRSILRTVNIGRGNIDSQPWAYKLRPLALDQETLFPQPEGPERSLVEEYFSLWQGFQKEVSELSALKERPLLLYQRLDWLSYKYFWCVPSSTIDEPDISLYDHARTTAAVAAALYEFHKERGTLTRQAVEDRQVQAFRLIAGDLSGIQRALFNFEPGHNRGVAKMLRAKSFYLSAVLDAVLELLAQEVGVHPAQTFLHAGGHFVALVPNLPELLEKLAEIERIVDRWTLDRFDGQVSVVLDYSVTASPQDFRGNGFSRLWSRLSESLDVAKRRKLQGALQNKGSGTWAPQEQFVLSARYETYKQTGKCTSCGQEPALAPGEEGERCRTMRELGRRLVRDPVLIWNDAGTGLLTFFDGRVGLDVYSWSELDTSRLPRAVTKVQELNSMGASTACMLLANHVPRFDPSRDDWLRQRLPEDLADTDPGDALPLSAIALRSNGSRDEGVPRLGILKGDVDHLGFIFSAGLPAQQFSVSRLASLSRMLDLFFGGYLNELVKKEFDNTYVVYAGGDDFLVLSDWQSGIDLADRLEADFREFVCRNRNVTLSAGLAVTSPRFPVRLGATHSDELLEEAKNQGRSRFTLLGATVEWPYFRRELRPFAESLDRWLRAGVIHKAFLYRLLQYHRMHRDTQRSPECAIYRSHLAYDIKRNIEDSAKAAEVEPRTEALRAEALRELTRLFDLRSQDRSLMDLLCVPVQWTIYKERQKEA